MSKAAQEAKDVMTSVHDSFVQDSDEAQGALDGAGGLTTILDLTST